MGAIADRLLQLIQKSDMSYADLEKETGIPKSALQRYATGITEKIPVERVKILASVLGSTAEYILGWDKIELKDSEIIDFHAQTTKKPATDFDDRPLELDEIESKLVELVRKMTPDQKKMYFTSLEAGLKSQGLM